MGNSNPGWTYGQRPSTSDWAGAFSAKQDWDELLDVFIALGGQKVGTAETIAHFQESTDGLPLFNVQGLSAVADGGGGNFLLAPGDATTPDNGVTVIVDGSGNRYYRGGRQSKVIDARWCGAKGDGASDDAAAINKFLAIAGHGWTLEFPDGYTFLVGSSISVTVPGVAFRLGTSAKIVAGSVSYHLFDVGAAATGVSFSGGQIVGHVAYSCINLAASGCSVDNVEFSNCLHGVSVNNGSSVGPATYNNAVRNCTFAAPIGDHAIFANSGGNKMLIQGNAITAPTGNGVWVGNGSNDTIIDGNHVASGGRIGIEVWNGNARCTVSNNNVNTTVNQGISVEGSPNTIVIGNNVINSGEIGIEIAQESDDSVVFGNSVNTVTGGVGISLDGSTATIMGNVVDSPSSFGIQAIQGGSSTGPATHFVMKGNKFLNCGDNAIMLQANTAFFSVCDNVIEGGQGTAPIFLNEAMYGDISHNIIDIDETKYTHWFHSNGSAPIHTSHQICYNTIKVVATVLPMFYSGDNSGGMPAVQFQFNRMFVGTFQSPFYPNSPKLVSEQVTISSNSFGAAGINVFTYNYGSPIVQPISFNLPAAIPNGVDAHGDPAWLQPCIVLELGDFNGGSVVYANTSTSPVTVTFAEILAAPKNAYSTANFVDGFLDYRAYSSTTQMAVFRIDYGAVNTGVDPITETLAYRITAMF